MDVRRFELPTPCLQRERLKILNGFTGVAYTENRRSSRSSNVPKLYRAVWGAYLIVRFSSSFGRCTLRLKQTMLRIRNSRRSWTACSPGWKRCGNPTRTRNRERLTNSPSNRAHSCPSREETLFAKSEPTTKPSSTPTGQKNRLWVGITTSKTKSSFLSWPDA